MPIQAPNNTLGLLGKRGGRLFGGEQQLIDQLLSQLRERGPEFIQEARGGFTEERQARQKELADILAGQREETFSETAPAILEQLGQRGLLHSSATGEALAEERGRLQRESDALLRQQALQSSAQDIGFEQNLMGNLLGQELGLMQQPLGRFQQLGDFRLQEKLAKDLASKQAQTQKKARRSKLLGSLLGTGLGIGSMFIPGAGPFISAGLMGSQSGLLGSQGGT